MTIKQLKKGDLFTKRNISEPKDCQVWVRGEYDRSTGRYVCTRWSDFCDAQALPGNREVFVDFTF